jgi:hypothetical protein
MNFRPLIICFTIVAAALFVRADAPSPDLPAPDADGFVSLFNGKDLTGWDGLDGFWSVKDGAIAGAESKEHPAPQTDLNLAASVANPEKFANFELRYAYRFTTPDGNSGLQFRSKLTDKQDGPVTKHCGGYQADCDATQGYDGTIYDESGVAGGRKTMSNRGQSTHWTADNKRENTPLSESSDDLKKLIKVGEWNDVVLVANGNHVTYTVNGHLMTELVDDSPHALANGVIGLQLHHGFVMEVQFKDLRIKFLDDKAK